MRCMQSKGAAWLRQDSENTLSTLVRHTDGIWVQYNKQSRARLHRTQQGQTRLLMPQKAQTRQVPYTLLNPCRSPPHMQARTATPWRIASVRSPPAPALPERRLRVQAQHARAWTARPRAAWPPEPR